MTAKPEDFLLQTWKQQLDLGLRLIETMVEGAIKLREVQIEAATDAHADAVATRKSVADANDLAQLVKLQAEWTRANVQKCAAYWRDLNVFGAYVHGSDTLQQFDQASGDLVGEIQPTYHSFFAQADYLIYPWLQAAARYETLTPGDRTVPNLRTGVFNLSALIRANVKAMVEYQRDLRAGENHSLNALLRFAF